VSNSTAATDPHIVRPHYIAPGRRKRAGDRQALRALRRNRARGSSKETKGHLHRALTCGFITSVEYQHHWKAFDEIAVMLTGSKNYLEREDGRRQ